MLQLHAFPTTVPVMQAVIDKKIDIGGGGVAARASSGPSGVLYNHIREFDFEIVVPPESPLKSISDLKGSKLGILSGCSLCSDHSRGAEGERSDARRCPARSGRGESRQVRSVHGRPDRCL